MTEGIEDAIEESTVADPDAAATRRDELAAMVADHASQMARGLSLLQGGDYGQRSFETDAGTWTLKYEAGDVQYLRFESGSTETYVVSSKRQPDPDVLATALADYGSFVGAFNDYVRSVDGVLDDVEVDFPEVASTATVADERNRIVARIRDYADRMAGELHRTGSNYGTFEARVDGTRWELKWEDGRASYLRVGGQDGVYLLSQYDPPTPRDLREHVDGVGNFVAAFNEHVEELSESLETVSL